MTLRRYLLCAIGISTALLAAMLALLLRFETYTVVDGTRVLHHTTLDPPETVQQLLNRMEISLNPQDDISRPTQSPPIDGMVLTIGRRLTREETYCVSVPCETRYCRSESLPLGAEEVLVSGQEGELMRRASVTYRNGQEIARDILEEQAVSLPVIRVVARGTREPRDKELQISDNRIHLPTGETLTYTHTATIRATAYTHTDEGCDMTTATGTRVHVGTVAVDPRYIPYGTRMFIMASDGSYIYGVAQAEDCGGDIKGDRMDLYLPSYAECIAFGRRVCTVYFLG